VASEAKMEHLLIVSQVLSKDDVQADESDDARQRGAPEAGLEHQPQPRTLPRALHSAQDVNAEHTKGAKGTMRRLNVLPK
jgi:hypothetical protein